MKASRAYIASLGTTGVLLCFALLLLMVVSAILAFQGWPTGASDRDSGAAVRLDVDRGITALAPVRFETGAAPRRAAQSAATASPALAKRASRDRGGVQGVSEGGARAPARVQAGPASAPAAQSGTAPVTAPDAPHLGQVSRGVADTTRQVTQGAAGAVGAVGGVGVDNTVSGTGQAVSELVQRSGDTAERQLPSLP